MIEFRYNTATGSTYNGSIVLEKNKVISIQRFEYNLSEANKKSILYNYGAWTFGFGQLPKDWISNENINIKTKSTQLREVFDYIDFDDINIISGVNYPFKSKGIIVCSNNCIISGRDLDKLMEALRDAYYYNNEENTLVETTLVRIESLFHKEERFSYKRVNVFNNKKTIINL